MVEADTTRENTVSTARSLTLLPALALGLVGLAALATWQGAPPTGLAPTGLAPTVQAPVSDGQRPVIELVFAIDTTGSMSGLLEGAKAKVWSIVDQFASGQPRPEIRVGLVAYRDRGDDYVTKVVPLSDDLDAVWAALLELQAGGGGDGPESVNQAVYEAVTAMQWTARAPEGPPIYRALFVVGDAPPHIDYAGDVPYATSVAQAVQQGIGVHAVQCGSSADAREHFEEIARLGGGAYLPIAQDGGMAQVETPMDAELAALNRELAGTALAWGSVEEQAELGGKLARALGADSALSAARGSYLSKGGGRVNSGRKDLVAAVADGEVAVADVAVSELPPPLQAMSVAEREATVAAHAARRRELQARVATVVTERDRWLAQESRRGGTADAFDARVQAEVIGDLKALGYIDY